MASDKFDVNGGLSVNGTTAIDANRNIFAAGATFTGSVSIGGVAVTSVVSSFNGATGAVTYSPRLATASLTGVASFGNEFVVSAAGAVSLTGNYVKTFNGATGAVVYAPPLATSSVTGVASFTNDFLVSAAGAVSLTGSVVRSVNGVTGAVTLAQGTNVTISTVGNTITINSSGGGGSSTPPPLATSSITGVASFNATNFAVSATGNVSLLAKSITASVDFGSAVDRIGFTIAGLTTFNQTYQFAYNKGLTASLRNATQTRIITGTIDSSSSYWNGARGSGLSGFTGSAGSGTGPGLITWTPGVDTDPGTGYTAGYTGPGCLLANFRNVDIVMRGPFTQGATSYSVDDLLGMSLVTFNDKNIYTRIASSGVSGDGGFIYLAGISAGGPAGLTFSGRYVFDSGAGITYNAGLTFNISGLYKVHKEDTHAITTVTGQSWVTANHYIQCRTMGLSSVDHDAEDAIIEGVRFEINNVVAGVGFDIIGHAPEGTYGKYMVKCIGQSV
jgi:hypothetical protein